MTDDEQQAALEIYIKIMEIAPHPDITPTPDQLSAIHYIMSQKRAPYADFLYMARMDNAHYDVRS
jgi:hypothetical protein